MPLTERDRACFGPRDAKPLGSLAWCWQTLDLLKTRWQRKDFTDQHLRKPSPRCANTPCGMSCHPSSPTAPWRPCSWRSLGRACPQRRRRARRASRRPAPQGADGASRQGTPPGHRIREVTRAYFGDQATFAYAAFDTINRTLFAGALPLPLVTWEITGHGRCLGLTQSGTRPPHIVLHPGTLRGASKPDPWKTLPPGWGRCLPWMLLHECLHVAVTYVRGGRGQATAATIARRGWARSIEWPHS